VPSCCSDIKPSAGHIFERLIIPKLPPQYVTVAVGIVGAVIMPHNLYLHSALVQSRWVLTYQRRRTAAATQKVCFPMLAKSLWWLRRHQCFAVLRLGKAPHMCIAAGTWPGGMCPASARR
jgi:NRAMP (natural resistance-associated macrophage protein)-like metal ion transporter